MRRRNFTQILILGAFYFFAFALLLQGTGETTTASEGVSVKVLNHLLDSPKILSASTVLEDFLDKGSETTRVIVNLRETETVEPLIAPAQSDQRKSLAARVHERVTRILQDFNATQIQNARSFKYMPGFSARVTAEGLEALTENPEVLFIEKDVLLYPTLAQGIPLMNASSARSTYGGEGLSVAICDTGIDYTHVNLGNGGFPNNKVIGGYDTGDDDNNPMDVNGHGTACAGISAGDLGTNGDYIGGVAWGAKLYALKISHGSGGSAYVSNMVEAWEWCITHQYDDADNPILIINTSFGGGNYTGYCDTDSPALTTAAANAKAAGMTLFVSSGNEGYCNGLALPGCISHVVPVGAVYDAHFTADSIEWCVEAGSCANKIPESGLFLKILLTGNPVR